MGPSDIKEVPVTTKVKNIETVEVITVMDYVNLYVNLTVCDVLTDVESFADIMNNTYYETSSSNEVGEQPELSKKPILWSAQAIYNIKE